MPKTKQISATMQVNRVRKHCRTEMNGKAQKKPREISLDESQFKLKDRMTIVKLFGRDEICIFDSG